ncbi:hypothetical protein HKCCE3408_01400 [Rhodobacterales bacterium HKCCE3408]|nr:hypothetical protein [Rhodobacterales bacterium HKCCE3408]
MVRIIAATAALFFVLATSAFANNCNLGRLEASYITGTYTMVVSPTSASMGPFSNSQQGNRTAPVQIVVQNGQLELQGWPTPFGQAPLTVTAVGADWSWPAGSEGIMGSDQVQGFLGCPIQALPGLETTVQTRGAETGIGVTHVLRLVVMSENSIAGYWTFSAPGAGIVGQATVFIQ